MSNTKKLNLTKYAFLDYLKGDIFSWLNCNDNYQVASKANERLRNLTPWRFKDEEDVENDFDIDEFYSSMRYGVEEDDLDLSKETPDQIKAGIRVGEYSELWAKLNWPDHKVLFVNGNSNEENVRITKQALDSIENLLMFEGTFTYNDFNIRADIIVKTGDEVKVIEVKGSGSPKLLYGFDLMFQREVIERSNDNYINWDYSLLLLNREYIHNKEYNKEEKAKMVFVNTNMVTNAHQLGGKKIPEYDPDKPTNWIKSLNYRWYNPIEDWLDIDETPLFKYKTGRSKNFTFEFESFFNCTFIKEMRNNFDDILNKIKEIQLMDQPPKLEFESRNNKFLKSDYTPWALEVSGAYEVNDSIFDFRGNALNWDKKCKYFKEGKSSMRDLSIEEIVPSTLLNKVKGMSDEQAIMEFMKLDSKKGSASFGTIIQRNYFDKDETLKHRYMLLEDLQQYNDGPIYMYDFETANLAIPEVDGSSPYEQIVYQYSIHVILDPNDFDFKTMKNVIHYEWLAQDRDNFHIQAWENFKVVFEKHGPGKYVAWNKSFEINCIKRALEKWNFDDEVSGWLETIMNETIDLMDSFRAKFYYHKDLKGSYSIKYAGPHFAKEIDYKNLNLVQKGDQSAAVAKMWLRERTKQSDEDWFKRRKDMLKYCEYDTLLMVAILQRLKEKVYD